MMLKSLFSTLLLFVCLFLTTRIADATNNACPINTSDITGVMQWNDGFPFSHYGRDSHCYNGNCNSFQVIDVNAYYGSSIFSPVDGQVVHLVRNGGNVYNLPGMYKIGIKGDDGLYYGLAHTMHPTIQKGSRVAAGQHIANLTSLSEAVNDASYQRICDTDKTDTTPECLKVHLHFDVYDGTGFDQPYTNGGKTLNFLEKQCGLKRPSGSISEFPQLPTLNCARITGNPNIHKCFSSRPPSPTPTPVPTLTPSHIPNPSDYDKDGDVDFIDVALLKLFTPRELIFSYTTQIHEFN